MRRREFIAGLGSAAAWPMVADAQQEAPVRRIGVLTPFQENDPGAKGWLTEFTQGLAELGWTDRRNVRLDIRWGGGNLARLQMIAKELVELHPDVMFVASTPAARAMHLETRTIPVVFVLVAEPEKEGFVSSVARPGGNMTGFLPLEPSMGGKWLQVLGEIAPDLKRAAFMFNPDTAPYATTYFLPSFEAGARLLKMEPLIAPVRSAADIEAVITSLGGEPRRGGLIVSADSFLVIHRPLIISLSARYNVPTINNDLIFAKDGGLLSYGPASERQFRRAAFYVDRILKGAAPADLPVELPIKLEMAVNVKTAKALGLTVPPSILLRADEVIE
jgi:putative tryptophan/tyrosine transport system substrate-binding protein